MSDSFTSDTCPAQNKAYPLSFLYSLRRSSFQSHFFNKYISISHCSILGNNFISDDHIETCPISHTTFVTRSPLLFSCLLVKVRNHLLTLFSVDLILREVHIAWLIHVFYTIDMLCLYAVNIPLDREPAIGRNLLEYPW